jgi:hypothetical protein
VTLKMEPARSTGAQLTNSACKKKWSERSLSTHEA